MATKQQFKAWDPHVKAYSSRRTNDEWEQHRPMLTRMHNKCRPRREMIAQLKQRGFEVTLSQLSSQLNKWGLTIGSRNVVPGSYDGRETSSTTSDPQADGSVGDADHQFFNSLPTPRENSPNPSRSRPRTGEADSSRSIENEVINAQGPSPPPMSTKVMPIIKIPEITVLSQTPKSNGAENRSATVQKAPQSSFTQHLRRKKAVGNLMCNDLAEQLLDDIEIDWHATFAEDSSGNNQQLVDLLYPDYSNSDHDFFEKIPAFDPPDHDQLSKQSDTISMPDTLVNGDSSTVTQTPYNNNDQVSPIGSDESLHLFPDFESVFGNKFSNLNPTPKPKMIVPEEEDKPSPKSYSLKLRDRISKNSPSWESTFPSMASAGSIIRHLPTIVEPWCSSFPSQCCCKSLFFGRDGFGDSPELYRIFLEQSQSEIESLQYVMALLNLAEVKSIGSHKEVLKGKFREALEFYLKLCTRVDFKNSMASTILHRLLKVSEKLLEGEYSATKRLSTRSLSSTSLKTSALLEKIFETPPTNDQSTETINKNSSWFKECADNAIILDYDGLGPSTFSSLNKQGRNFGMRPWAFNFDAGSADDNNEEAESTTEYPRPVFDGLFLTTTAAHVATMLEHQHKSTPVRGVSAELDSSNSSKVFSALGLMIALEFSTNVSFLYEVSSPISDPAHWTSQMTRFVYTFIESLGQNADCADKFRKAYWLARTSKIGREGKGVHTGPCKAVKEWAILERSIYEFDEDRPWIERKFLANRLSLPHDNDIVLGDQMSIHSESSATSFDRFHQTAVRLQVGRVPSHKSAMSWKTTSSKRMSVESHLSWQLERVLAINDGDTMSLTETLEEE